MMRLIGLLTKRIALFAVGFAVLGVLIGACVPIFSDWLWKTAASQGLHPLRVLLYISIPIGLFLGVFLGALTGLASAFSTGRFATVRCLLAIIVSVFLARGLYVACAGRFIKGEPPRPWWHDAIVLLVPVTVAVLIAILSYRQSRATEGNSSDGQGPKTEPRIEQVSETANSSYSQRPLPADHPDG